MHQDRWLGPCPLADWRVAARGPGLYIIGCRQDERLPMGPPLDTEGKLGGLPENFVALYGGQSLSYTGGVRDRLSRHFRGTGNRYVRKAIANQAELWFVYLAGVSHAEFEVLYISIGVGIPFPFNIRNEVIRATMRMGRAIEEAGLLAPDPFAFTPLLERRPVDFGWPLL